MTGCNAYIYNMWWAESYLPKLNFYRKRHVELYFWAVLSTFEPEFGSSRIAFAKISTLMTVLDDLYDTHGTLDEIRIFTEGMKRWDSSLIGRLPDHIQKIFEFFINTANEWAAEVENKQRRDMAAYIRKNGWERYLSYLQEAEWMAAGYVPSLSEYYKNGLASSGMCVLNLIPLLLMDQILPDDILKQILYPSKIHDLLELTVRVKDDITDFEQEKERGEVASSLESYVKDNPECTLEDALKNHMKGILDLSVSQLNWEFLKHDNVPLCCKRFTFNLARGMHFLFKYKDGISLSDNEVKDQIFKVLIEPVQL
eukprot:PITA_06420